MESLQTTVKHPCAAIGAAQQGVLTNLNYGKNVAELPSRDNTRVWAFEITTKNLHQSAVEGRHIAPKSNQIRTNQFWARIEQVAKL